MTARAPQDACSNGGGSAVIAQQLARERVGRHALESRLRESQRAAAHFKRRVRSLLAQVRSAPCASKPMHEGKDSLPIRLSDCPTVRLSTSGEATGRSSPDPHDRDGNDTADYHHGTNGPGVHATLVGGWHCRPPSSLPRSLPVRSRQVL